LPDQKNFGRKLYDRLQKLDFDGMVLVEKKVLIDSNSSAKHA
jgi:hypothetical protein